MLKCETLSFGKVSPMKITYLVANYNNGKYIPDCIDSLRQQTNPNWLCFIADDGSTDNSLEIIKPLLNRKIHILENIKNTGYIKTLQQLIKNAQTEIVGILDADDALSPDATERILNAYVSNPTIGFVYSNYALFNEDLSQMLSNGLCTHIKKTSITGGFVGHLKTFKVNVYRQTLGLDINMIYAEDRDLVYKMEEVTEFHFINEVLYKYRQIGISQSNEPHKKKIGLRNHLQACRNAMKRRNVQGIEELQYRLAILANLPHDKNPIRRVPIFLRKLTIIGIKICVRILGMTKAIRFSNKACSRRKNSFG